MLSRRKGQVRTGCDALKDRLSFGAICPFGFPTFGITDSYAITQPAGKERCIIPGGHISFVERIAAGLERSYGMMRGASFGAAVFFILVALTGCGQGGGHGRKAAPKEQEGAGAKNWLPYNEGMALAAKENRKAIIDFYASWCRWCKVMDRETFRNPEVEKYLAEHFVTIRIDAENKTDSIGYQGRRYTPASLARSFGVRGYPSLAYLDEDGDLITLMPGYVPAERFLPLLEYVQGNYYKRSMTFDEFLKRRGEGDTSVAR